MTATPRTRKPSAPRQPTSRPAPAWLTLAEFAAAIGIGTSTVARRVAEYDALAPDQQRISPLSLYVPVNHATARQAKSRIFYHPYQAELISGMRAGSFRDSEITIILNWRAFRTQLGHAASVAILRDLEAAGIDTKAIEAEADALATRQLEPAGFHS